MATGAEKLARVARGAPAWFDQGLRAAAGVLLAMVFMADWAIESVGLGSPIKGLWLLAGGLLGWPGQVGLALPTALLILYASGVSPKRVSRMDRASVLRIGAALGALEVFARFSLEGSLLSGAPISTAMASAVSFVIVAIGGGCCASLAMDAFFGRVGKASSGEGGSPAPAPAQAPAPGPHSAARPVSGGELSGGAAPRPRVSQEGGDGAKYHLYSAALPLIPGLIGAFSTLPGTRARRHALAALDAGAVACAAIALACWISQGNSGAAAWLPLIAWAAFALMALYEAQRAAAGWAPSKNGRVQTLSVFFDD